jgi:hypothetical protein
MLLVMKGDAVIHDRDEDKGRLERVLDGVERFCLVAVPVLGIGFVALVVKFLMQSYAR